MSGTRKYRRRPPSDKRLLDGATNPRIVKTVVVTGGLIVALGAGLILVIRGLL